MTVVASIFVKVIGFPHQVRQNYKRRSTHGLSTPFILTSVLAYTLWTVYGLLKGDWVVVFGQGAGVIITGIILYQIWIYRENKSED